MLFKSKDAHMPKNRLEVLKIVACRDQEKEVGRNLKLDENVR